jgi:hypothetical protein
MKTMTTISRKSILSGKTRTKTIYLDPDDLSRYEMGMGLIQDVFPYLTPSEREFIMTGITDDEFPNDE